MVDGPCDAMSNMIALAPPSPPAFSPLYRQIKDLIVRSLQAAEWGPGQAIPSEMELAARFRVSQGTVRKAVDELASENLLVRRQGKGTFVVSHAETNTQYRFLRLMADGGETAGLQRRLLGCRRTRATTEVARALGLKSGESVVEIRRVLLDEQGPVVLDDIFLPGPAFKGLSSERLLQWKGPMYRLFEAEFAVTMIRAEERLRAVAADAAQAQALGVGEGFPLLSVERLSFTYGDRPMELRRGLYRTDRHHYRNDLS
jgi:GntR family transcriptional regulator